MTEPNVILECHFSDIIQLYRAYMPFVKSGAVFLPTEKDNINIGDTIAAKIMLPEQDKPIEFTGKVVWLSPKKLLSEDSKTGIGVQFEGEDAVDIREQIEMLVRDYLNSDQPTDTM